MPPTARLLKQHHPGREDVPDGPLGSTPVEIRQIFDLSVHIAGDWTVTVRRQLGFSFGAYRQEDAKREDDQVND